MLEFWLLTPLVEDIWKDAVLLFCEDGSPDTLICGLEVPDSDVFEAVRPSLEELFQLAILLFRCARELEPVPATSLLSVFKLRTLPVSSWLRSIAEVGVFREG